MAKKCRHRKGIILATAGNVEFTPDQEPFTTGVIESCGIETIMISAMNIHYCPKCNGPMNSIEGFFPFHCKLCKIDSGFKGEDLARVLSEIP